MGNRRALVGIHLPAIAGLYQEVLGQAGYDVSVTDDLQEMLRLVEESEYDKYIMDLNLGVVAGQDISPARDVCAIISGRDEGGLTKFLGVSSASNVVAAAEREGIPAADKNDISRVFAFLQGE